MTPEETERRKLMGEIRILFFPHTNEQKYFFDLGFPSTVYVSEGYSADYDNWRPKVRVETNPEMIRNLLYGIRNRDFSLDEVTEKIFEFKTFIEFIDYINFETKSSRVAASSQVLHFLKTTKPSKTWNDAIRHGRPDAVVMSWLEDLGDRLSTHSSVGELFQVQRSEIAPYTEAARIGYCTVEYVLNKSKLKFNAKKTTAAGHRLVGDCCFMKASAPLLLKVICEDSRDLVAELIGSLDSQMKQMLGHPPTKAKIYFSADPMPFELTLWETAHRAAMLAAICYDPTACEIYKGLFFQKTLIDPKTAEWFQSKDEV